MRRSGLIVAGLLSVSAWLLFFPAIMSNDSLDQYAQAVTRNYHDWHPPLMSLVLSGVLRVGGDIGSLMFIQCLIGGAGVYYWSWRIARSHCSKNLAVPLAVLTTLLLFSPLTPLICYLMTFWKDSWGAITFVWMLAIADALYHDAPCYSVMQRSCGYVALMSVMLIALLVRHNAIVIVPSCMAILWMLLRRHHSAFTAFLCSGALLPLFLGLHQLPYAVFHATARHPEQQVIVLDLVGMIIEQPSLRAELPLISHDLTPYYAEQYRAGDVSPIYWDARKILTDDFHYSDAMRQEYARAVWRFPMIWLKVKWRAFAQLIRPDRTYYYAHVGIVNNPFGLQQNDRFRSVRETILLLMQMVLESPWGRLFSGVHLLWMTVNLGVFVLFAASYLRARNRDALWRCLLCSIPLAYYASYLLATTCWDYRMMYPATLTIQVAAVTFCLAYPVTMMHACRRPNPPASTSITIKK